MQVTIFSARPYEKEFLLNSNQQQHTLKFIPAALSQETLTEAEGSDAISLFTSDDASAPVLEKLHGLGIKYIALRCAGYDHVNLAKAEELGIKVANVPSYSPYSIAEHTATLLMALNRKIVLAQKQMQQNNFALDNLIGFDLHGKTVGIIGMGKIGQIFANIMVGFGCRVLAYDIAPPAEKKEHITFVSLEEVLTQADILSLHAPLNPATRYLINAASISTMKKGVVFLNTSRGGLVNTKDLIAALKSGQVSAAGLDVYENEKGLFFNDLSGRETKDPVFEELRQLPNVLITGHQAFLTQTALGNIADTTLYNLNQWAKGETSDHELTRQVVTHTTK